MPHAGGADLPKRSLSSWKSREGTHQNTKENLGADKIQGNPLDEGKRGEDFD